MPGRVYFSPHDDIPDPLTPGPPTDLRFVQGGSFVMGSHDWAATRPLHKVTLTSFYVSPTLVTQEQWADIMGTRLSTWNELYAPVTLVDWYKAIDYCNARSSKEQLTPCYKISGKDISCDWSANGYRLPTEAEWELAARGGIGGRNTIYSGSNDIEEVAWFGENAGDRAHSVAKKTANDIDVFDLSGNVREWCWDWYGKYPDLPATDPHGPASGTSKVMRGGSYSDAAYMCTVYVRMALNPAEAYLNNGFRVVRLMR